MPRSLTFACIALLCFQSLCVSASAVPPSYDIFCSPGTLPAIGTAAAGGTSKFAIGTQAGMVPNGDVVCGWFTRSWRPGEPDALCFPAAMLQDAQRLGAYGSKNLLLPHVWSFAVYNDSQQGCMVVTGIAPNESHAFAPLQLTCNSVFTDANSISIGALKAYRYTIDPVGDAGTCTDLQAYGMPAGEAFPHQGYLCADGAETYGNYIGSVTFKPWWPCGLATSSEFPTAFTLLVPMTIALPAASYHPPYTVNCQLYPPPPVSGPLPNSIFGTEHAVPIPPLTAGPDGTYHFSQTLTMPMVHELNAPSEVDPSLTYTTYCGILSGPSAQSTEAGANIKLISHGLPPGGTTLPQMTVQ